MFFMTLEKIFEIADLYDFCFIPYDEAFAPGYPHTAGLFVWWSVLPDTFSAAGRRSAGRIFFLWYWDKRIFVYDGTIVKENIGLSQKHLELIKEHKWSDLYNVDILDAESDDVLEIPNVLKDKACNQ